MDQNLAWYTARSAGLVSWALLTLSTIWGLSMSTRLGGRRRGIGSRFSRRWILDLHRFLGGLGTIFVAVHLVAILADTYIAFTPTQVLVPFTADYRPSAVAWGIAAFYLLVAVELTSLARRWFPNRTWRLIHMASLPMYLIATIHMITAGTDAVNPILRVAAAASAIVVSVLTVYRIWRTGGVDPRPSEPDPLSQPGPSPQLAHR